MLWTIALLGNTFGKEKIFEIIIYFIFNRKFFTIWRCLYTTLYCISFTWTLTKNATEHHPPTHPTPFKHKNYWFSILFGRGFDFGNHFCEWSCDYSCEAYPFYSYHPEDYPSEQTQVGTNFFIFVNTCTCIGMIKSNCKPL